MKITSVRSAGNRPNAVAALAIPVRSSDGALTLLVINKQLTAGAVTTVNVANFLAAGTGLHVWTGMLLGLRGLLGLPEIPSDEIK